MPTPEEIKNLAHEYGVHMAKDIPMSNCLKNEVVSSTEEYIVQFMSWLTKDYAIVPKEMLRDYYHIYKEAYLRNPSFQDRMEYHKGAMQAMEHLFGKSLFEE